MTKMIYYSVKSAWLMMNLSKQNHIIVYEDCVFQLIRAQEFNNKPDWYSGEILH